jgi:hypothetical protein
MAIRVPSAAAAAEKWARVAPGRQQDYQAGIQSAGQAWQEGVNAGAANFAQGVQQAIAEGRYEKGVQGKQSKYVQKTSTVGLSRWGAGITAARPDYESGVARALQALSAVSLPPKGPKGAPQNLQRVAAVVEALRATR